METRAGKEKAAKKEKSGAVKKEKQGSTRKEKPTELKKEKPSKIQFWRKGNIVNPPAAYHAISSTKEEDKGVAEGGRDNKKFDAEEKIKSFEDAAYASVEKEYMKKRSEKLMSEIDKGKVALIVNKDYLKEALEIRGQKDKVTARITNLSDTQGGNIPERLQGN
ncbi:uncharacterized protein LOC131036489 [Cryptomeria japonica]|uniref:uncharacterized protein LOC131036489 n=1 Tax=Cryptomeria japonica TaxID=3369 RepID=UPI0027DA0300|nr:uncharacterized protein LOC131036489 [Cryptomeria japonica]